MRVSEKERENVRARARKRKMVAGADREDLRKPTSEQELRKAFELAWPCPTEQYMPGPHFIEAL
jgi:hypothetical protein